MGETMYIYCFISVRKNIMEISCLYLVLAFFQLAYSSQLPSDIEKCKFLDGKCLTSSVNYVIKRYGKTGLPEINLPPLDAVKVPDVALSQDDKKKAVWYQAKAKNIIIYGLENTTISKFKTNWETKSVDLYGQIPSLVGELDYGLKTKILAISINTTGHGTAEAQNFRFVIKSNFVIDNHGFLKIYKLNVNKNIDRAIFDLTNVNADNTDIAIVLNQMLNDNWQDIWFEVMPILDSILKENLIKNFNNIFSKMPFKDLFLPEDAF